MKRKLSLLLCTAFLLTLTACGGMGNTDATGNGAAEDETLTDGEDGTVAGEKSMQKRIDEQVRTQMGSRNNIFGAQDSTGGDTALRSQVYGSKNGASTQTTGADCPDGSCGNWEKMLRDAKVHDTDGDLTDGENALHGIYGVQTKQG